MKTLPCSGPLFHACLPIVFIFSDSLVSFVQVTQQIFVAEEWAKSSREELNIEVQSRLAAEKAAGALRLEKEHLGKEIKEALKARDSAKAGLKTTTKQAEDMRQQLHQLEINHATEKQMVSDLKA